MNQKLGKNRLSTMNKSESSKKKRFNIYSNLLYINKSNVVGYKLYT